MVSTETSGNTFGGFTWDNLLEQLYSPDFDYTKLYLLTEDEKQKVCQLLKQEVAEKLRPPVPV